MARATARARRIFTPFSICAIILPALAGFVAPPAHTASEKIRIAPHFAAGQSFYYRVETHSSTTGKVTTPIENPEGESKTSQAVTLLVKLDVIGASQALPGAQQIRFRATFEQASAQSDSDAFNPDAPSVTDPYKRVEGQTLEFTLQPNGQLTDFNGLSDSFPKLSATDAVIAWAGSLATGGRVPQEGVSIGQKWNNERQLEGLPLTGVFWRSESTYSRDDVCGPVGNAGGQSGTSKAGGRDCAIILTHFEISRHGSDATPEEYRRNGLRTSGTWNGSGESLDAISLASGYLESSTQTSTQNIDYEIISAASGSSIHRVSKVEAQTEIRRLSAPYL
ncbi:MAG TPA: hypothetical protein VG322_05060 [Candidatus Acidoferrales bacterium]|jgi:hypothetical protein|nr:hypothetical protein [Candidatus Acidoferrales bacterium]